MPITQGKKTLQRMALRRNGWTKARRRAFLEALGQTCNVRTAAKTVGKSCSDAYRLRSRDPEFAGLWAEAVADGAQRLREEMIVHQLGQLSSGDNPTMDGVGVSGSGTTPAQSTRSGSFDPVKAVAALKAFDGFGDGRRRSIKPATQAEVDRALMTRLEALALRMMAAEGRAAGLPTPTAGREGGGEGA